MITLVWSSASVRPTLLIESENSTVRSKAKNFIKNSLIWQRTLKEHPGLKLATCARGPRECKQEYRSYWTWDSEWNDYYHADFDQNTSKSPFSVIYFSISHYTHEWYSNWYWFSQRSGNTPGLRALRNLSEPSLACCIYVQTYLIHSRDTPRSIPNPRVPHEFDSQSS